jgi:arylsulfatase A-like enzyme
MRPNIIFIIADDTTPRYHGCYGGPTPTPHLDSLAGDGVLFRQCRCVAPLCNPSRYSVFTGRYVGRDPSVWQAAPEAEPYYVLQNTRVLRETPTVAKMLRDAGYYTCHVGKWHSNWETSFGADEHAGKIGPADDLDDPETQARRRAIYEARLSTVRECGGFDEAHALSWGNIGAANGPPPIRVHNVAWQTDAALGFLERAARRSRALGGARSGTDVRRTDAPQGGGQPFYLHIAETVPHGPDPAQELGKDHRYTAGGILDHDPAGHPADDTVRERLVAAGFSVGGRLYGINAGMVMLDDQVGAILAKLRELELEDNTLIVYVADHGIAGKGSCYHPGTHVPLLMRWPTVISPGTVVEEPVMHVDFLPTLLAAAGAEVSGTPDAGAAARSAFELDGINLIPRLKGGAPIDRAATYAEMGWTRSILKGRYHYIAFRYPQSAIDEMESGRTDVAIDHVGRYKGSFGDMNARSRPHYFDPDQLYDVEVDPYERTNLAGDPAYRDILAELKAGLKTHLESFSRPFPLEIPDFMGSDAFRALVRERQARMDPPFPQPAQVEEVYGRNLPSAPEGHHGG